ncbi:MAG: hypothetical protein ABUS57_21935 [Pseudomonadota bacterium]
MSAAFVTQAPLWLALVLIIAACAIALTALMARSLIAAVLTLVASFALIATALMAQGEGDAALALALIAAGFAPFALMGVLLLTGRAVKARRGAPWTTFAAAAAAALAIIWISPDITAAPAAVAAAPMAPWLALLMLVAGAGVFALIGVGERGVFEPRVRDEAL